MGFSHNIMGAYHRALAFNSDDWKLWAAAAQELTRVNGTVFQPQTKVYQNSILYIGSGDNRAVTELSFGHITT